jgi:hypothetical protein
LTSTLVAAWIEEWEWARPVSKFVLMTAVTTNPQPVANILICSQWSKSRTLVLEQETRIRGWIDRISSIERIL